MSHKNSPAAKAARRLKREAAKQANNLLTQNHIGAMTEEEFGSRFVQEYISLVNEQELERVKKLHLSMVALYESRVPVIGLTIKYIFDGEYFESYDTIITCEKFNDLVLNMDKSISEMMEEKKKLHNILFDYARHDFNNAEDSALDNTSIYFFAAQKVASDSMILKIDSSIGFVITINDTNEDQTTLTATDFSSWQIQALERAYYLRKPKKVHTNDVAIMQASTDTTQKGISIGLSVSFIYNGERYSKYVLGPRDEFEELIYTNYIDKFSEMGEWKKDLLESLFNMASDEKGENDLFIDNVVNYLTGNPIILGALAKNQGQSLGFIFHLHGSTDESVSVTHIDFNEWCRRSGNLDALEIIENEVIQKEDQHIAFLSIEDKGDIKYPQKEVGISLHVLFKEHAIDYTFFLDMDTFELISEFSEKERLFNDEKKKQFHNYIFDALGKTTHIDNYFFDVIYNYACQYTKTREWFKNEVKQGSMALDMVVVINRPDLTIINPINFSDLGKKKVA